MLWRSQLLGLAKAGAGPWPSGAWDEGSGAALGNWERPVTGNAITLNGNAITLNENAGVGWGGVGWGGVGSGGVGWGGVGWGGSWDLAWLEKSCAENTLCYRKLR